MIIFLHGPDSFRSRQKLNLSIEQFKKQRDPAGNNVVRIEGEKTTLNELNSKTAAQSLLAEKRLLIIENLFAHKQKNIFKDLLEYLKKIENEKNENVLIFYEGRELDSKKFGAKKLLVAQKKLFDYLTTQSFSQKFDSLTQQEVVNWVQKKLNNITIQPIALQQLIAYLGNDLWLINNEVDKLINFVQAQTKKEITEDDVKNMVRGNIEENIFALTDAISTNNKALFFKLLEEQLEAGVNFQQILTMITRQFNIMLQIKESLLQGSNPANIASQLKLHPFVIKKTTPQTRNFSLDHLKETINQLINIDYKIKTGQADGLTSISILFAN